MDAPNCSTCLVFSLAIRSPLSDQSFTVVSSSEPTVTMYFELGAMSAAQIFPVCAAAPEEGKVRLTTTLGSRVNASTWREAAVATIRLRPLDARLQAVP